MIIDKQNRFSEAQAITATAASTDVIDQGAAGDSYEQSFLWVRVGTAFNTLTSLTIALQTDSAVGFGSATTLFSVVIALAGLTANTEIVKITVPFGLKRYVRAYYTVTGTNPTTGTLDAALVCDVKM